MPRRPTIKYTSREYATIRKDLIAHTKRYYPDTFRDFNEASFGSLMIDTVSYVGDILSFYLDYQVNESFLDTAIEYNNVIRHGRQLGYKFSRTHSSVGIMTCYIIVPALNEGLGPDTDYIPVLKRGSTVSTNQKNVFTLMEDVDFSKPENEVIVASVNSDTGIPINYAIKSYGKILSGEIMLAVIPVGVYEKFKQIKISDSNITEIVSVFDTEGREYFEVDYLSQNVVYKEVLNTNFDSTLVSNMLKPVIVPRRFTVFNERGGTFLQFGHGSESAIDDNIISEPSNVILDVHGRTYNADTSFDPSRLIETDKFGIVPENTNLRISYRRNTDSNANASTGAIINVVNSDFKFKNNSALDVSQIKRNNVISSLEVSNEDPIIGDVSLPNIDELKIRIYDVFATQNRAVTKQDYKAFVYSMPPKFGAIKRCNIIQDHDSFKRNLNLYIISNLKNGQLTPATSSLKENLRSWLNKNRMMNDTIDILDAKIVNFKIDYIVAANLDFDKFVVLNNIDIVLRKYFSVKMDVGENIIITDIYNVVNKIAGVSDVEQIKIANVVDSTHSSVNFNIENFTSADGKIIYAPKNVIFEVKYLFRDIKGVVK